MTLSFPQESARYRAARERLLRQEIDLRRQMEALAAARRRLPLGGAVPQDYQFHRAGPDGEATEVRMSGLFSPGIDTLVMYSFMFPRAATDERPGPAQGETSQLPPSQGPCPSCTSLLDQLEGAAQHLQPRVDFVAAAQAPVPHLRAFAIERGWRRLRLVSTRGTAYDRDYHARTPEGMPMPMLNVFVRTPEGIRHTWGSEMLYAPTDPGQDARHVGTIEPLWNLLDLTPRGRGELAEQLSYA